MQKQNYQQQQQQKKKGDVFGQLIGRTNTVCLRELLRTGEIPTQKDVLYSSFLLKRMLPKNMQEQRLVEWSMYQKMQKAVLKVGIV